MSVTTALETLCRELGFKGPEIHTTCDFKLGDGWLGRPEKVKILHEKGYLELLIKKAPTDVNYRKQICVEELYKNEAYFYKKFAQLFQNTQESKLFPKFYISSHVAPEEMVALEDLSARGFRTLSVRDSSKLLNSLLVLYAKFHAKSFCLRVKQPEVFEKVSTGLFENLVPFYEMFAESIVDQCERLERIFQSDGDERILEKLKEFRRDVVDIMTSREMYINKNSVIIHGDAWINNIMCDKQKMNFRLIDFQLTRLGSVVQDLSYLFYTCCNSQQMKNLNQYLLLYHNTLSFELERYGCDSEEVFPFSNLREEWKKFSKYGLGMTIVVLHGMLSRPAEFPDIRKVLEMNGNIFVSLNFDSVNEGVYNERIRDIFEHFITEEFL